MIILLIILLYQNAKKIIYTLTLIPFICLLFIQSDFFLKLLEFKSYSINTTKKLLTDGEYIYHSRLALMNEAAQFIKNNPYFNGIGSFEQVIELTYDKLLYPHNFILQFLIEYGFLIGFSLLLILLMLFLKLFFRIQKKSYEYLFFVYLSIEAAKLLFSRNYWTDVTFWVLVFMLILYQRHKITIHPIKD